MAIPKRCYERIVRRSGLAKLGIFVHGGMTDSDYCGDLCVVLFNISDEEYTVSIGNHIAQLIIKQ